MRSDCQTNFLYVACAGVEGLCSGQVLSGIFANCVVGLYLGAWDF